MKHLILLLLLISSAFGNAQKIYQVNTPVGFVLNAKATMINEMSMDESMMDGKKKSKKAKETDNIKTISKTIFSYRLICTEVTSSEVYFDFILDSMLMSVDNGSFKSEYNSQKQETFKNDDKIVSAFSNIGKKITVKVTKDGKLIKGDYNTQLIELSFIEFPNKVLNVNDTWGVTTIDNSMGIDNKTESTYKIDAVVGSDLIISGISKNALMGNEHILSTYKADSITGLLKSHDNTVEMEMMFKMKIRFIYSATW